MFALCVARSTTSSSQCGNTSETFTGKCSPKPTLVLARAIAAEEEGAAGRRGTLCFVEAEVFDEGDFFAALASGGARVLLIGRRAMIALGLPVLTADYDLWVHIDDIERLNQAVVPLDLVPNFPPNIARQRGRYVLENGEHVDVLVARSRSSPDGVRLSFEDAWARRQELSRSAGTTLSVPALDDLILTKRWAMRDKDIADIHLIEGLKRLRGE